MEKGTLKVYESKRFLYAQTTIRVGAENKRMLIEFTGGMNSPFRQNGRYFTRDVEIQKALENSKSFNKDYKLIMSEEDIPPEEIVEQPKKKIKGIQNAQSAREYLVKTYPGVTFRQLPNVQAILNYADKKLITFPEWDV